MNGTTRTRRIGRSALGTVAALCLLGAAVFLLAPSAEAATYGFAGDTTSGSLHFNGADWVLNQSAHVNAAIETGSGPVTAALSFRPTFTPTVPGPYPQNYYAKIEIVPSGLATGTTGDGGAISLVVPAHMDLTVYIQKGAEQDPATDHVASGADCRSPITLDLAGQIDPSTDTMTLSDPEFAIPEFPKTDESTAGCGASPLIVDGLNYLISGPGNALDLDFAGQITTTSQAPPSIPSSTQLASTSSSTLPPSTEGSTTTVPADDLPTQILTPGESINISGAGCAPGADVVVTLDDGTHLGTFTADEQGDFVAAITIPADLPLGQYLATAACPAPATRTKVRDAQFGGATSAGGVVEQFMILNIVAVDLAVGSSTTTPTTAVTTGSSPTTSSSTSDLPRTGSDSGSLAALGAFALTVGGAFIYGSRRIRTAR